jgi:hypothetical protein
MRIELIRAAALIAIQHWTTHAFTMSEKPADRLQVPRRLADENNA